MKNRYIVLYELPLSLAAEHAPVIITSGRLLMERFLETENVTLQLKSIDDRTVVSVTAVISPLDAKGMVCSTPVEYTYESLRLSRNEEYGNKVHISMPDCSVRSFSAFLSKVKFEDGSEWENTELFQPVQTAQTIEQVYGPLVAEQTIARYGEDCRYIPRKEDELWYCICGAANQKDELKCHKCRRKWNALEKINFQVIKEEALQAEKARKTIEQEEKTIKDEKTQSRVRLLKLLWILLPVLIVAGLVLATVPPLRERQRTYNHAELLLEEGKYNEAKELFSSLGTYSDAKIRAEKDVPYEAACAALSKAEQSSVSMADRARAYEAMLPLFDPLRGYKETDAIIDRLHQAIADFQQEKLEDAYQSAVKMMEKQEYLQARSMFQALDSYSDSAELMKECLYRRAVEILEFCKKYNTHNILLHLSQDPNQNSIIYMPESKRTELGSGVIDHLANCFDTGRAEMIYASAETDPEAVPICQALVDELVRLEQYKDSEDLIREAEAAGDYSPEFYDLLSSGQLREALAWLDAYPDVTIAQRERYQEVIPMYLEYCRPWTLYQGDASLIPYSMGVETEQLLEFTPVIAIRDNEAVMMISSNDGSYAAELQTPFGKDQFTSCPDGWSYYYALINQVDHFAYFRYLENGNLLSSCEYSKG